MAILRGVLMLLWLAVNTLFWALLTFVMALLRFVVPSERWRQRWGRYMNVIINGWVAGNQLVHRLLGTMQIELRGGETLSRGGWYLVLSNHQTWTDILVLQSVYGHRIPPLKFFMKQQLLWIPLLGAACYALDFPFMRRYSREFLEKHPEYRGRDLATAREKCERFRPNPTSILIFVEGTRFTAAKHQAQNSPYRHLLRPRAGGVGFVLGAMGDQLDAVVDTTIIYPDGTPNFWQFLCGRRQRVIVDIQRTDLSKDLVGGDYNEDPEFRRRIQAWIDNIWARKDALLEHELKAGEHHTGSIDDG